MIRLEINGGEASYGRADAQEILLRSSVRTQGSDEEQKDSIVCESKTNKTVLVF